MFNNYRIEPMIHTRHQCIVTFFYLRQRFGFICTNLLGLFNILLEEFLDV